jgi:hypothetical protein
MKKPLENGSDGVRTTSVLPAQKAAAGQVGRITDARSASPERVASFASEVATGFAKYAEKSLFSRLQGLKDDDHRV